MKSPITSAVLAAIVLMLGTYLWIEYSSYTLKAVLLVGVATFVIVLYLHRGMMYARAGFASLLFSGFLLAGWGITITGNPDTGSPELSIGSKSPSLQILAASVFFLLFSALMFWLHYQSDDEGRKVSLRDFEDVKWKAQLQLIVEEKIVAVTEELRRNEGEIESTALVGLPAEDLQLLIQRQLALEKKIQVIYEGKGQMAQPSAALNTILSRKGAGLITYESAVEMIDVSVPLAISMFEELLKNEEPKEIRTLLTISDLYRKVYRHEDARMCNDEALQIDPDNLMAKGRRAYYLKHDGDFEGAERLILSVIEQKEACGDPVAIDYSNYAGLLSDARRTIESIEYSNKAITAIESGDTSVRKEMVLANKAAALQNSGQFLLAQKLFFESYNSLVQVAPNGWQLGRSLCQISRFYNSHGSVILARRFAFESIEQYEKEDAANYLAIEETLVLLCEILIGQEGAAHFERTMEKQVRHFRSLQGATELVLQSGLWMFAKIYYENGRFDVAEPMFIESIDLYERAGSPNRLKYGNMLANLGNYYRFAKSDTDNAEKYLRSALSVRERFKGKLHEHTATTLKNLAGVLNDKGADDLPEAKRLYLRALEIRILRFGNADFTVAKWIRAFGWLDVHMRNFWLARIKFSYALQIYNQLGCNPFFDPNVLQVVGELNKVDRLESGEEVWPWMN